MSISNDNLALFSKWLGAELDALVGELDAYVTRHSLSTSLRRLKR